MMNVIHLGGEMFTITKSATSFVNDSLEGSPVYIRWPLVAAVFLFFGTFGFIGAIIVGMVEDEDIERIAKKKEEDRKNDLFSIEAHVDPTHPNYLFNQHDD